MPELPEVQTIVSDLNKVLPGLYVRDFWCDSQKMIKAPRSLEEFRKNIIGKKILGLRRRGKNILIDLSGEFTLLIHQKMTGHLLYGKYRVKIQHFHSAGSREKGKKLKNDKNTVWEAAEAGPLRDDPYNQHIHLILNLSNGKCLALSDVRKFAKAMLVKTEQAENLKELKELGSDPTDKNFTFKKLKEIIAKKSGKIKQVLMDQKNISGIGNIYADEILWEASVNPLRVARSLSDIEFQKIFKAIKEVLSMAIKAKGDSMSDYRRPSGEKGNYQNMQKVYRQTGKKCAKSDGGIIKRIKLGQRSTHFCPVHQK